MMSSRSELLSYLGGCIDCDGSISINRVKIYNHKARGRRVCYFVATIRLNQVTPVIPSLLRDVFGGIYKRYETRTRPGNRPLYTWQVTNRKATLVAKALLPYLRLKRRQAELVLRFDESMTRTRNGGHITDEIFEERERLYTTVASLNHSRNRKAQMPADASFVELEAGP